MQTTKMLLLVLSIISLSLFVYSAEARSFGGLGFDFESHIDGKIYKRIENGKPVIVVDIPSNVTLPIFFSSTGGEEPAFARYQITTYDMPGELGLPSGIIFQSKLESVAIPANEIENKTLYLQITVTEKAKIGKYEIPLYLTADGDVCCGTAGPSIILNVGKDFGPDVIPDNKLSIWGLSPLKQFKSGISALDVRCKEGLILVTKAGDNSPACVHPLTFNKLVERGWANSKPSETFYVFADDTRYEIPYHVTGWKNKILNMTVDLEAKSFLVTMQTKNNGDLTMTLPRSLIDPKKGEHDDDFFVLVDGNETNIQGEKKTDVERTITISFPAGTKMIEIIGSPLI